MIALASFVSTQYQRVMEDGQMDGRTDTLVSNTAHQHADGLQKLNISLTLQCKGLVIY